MADYAWVKGYIERAYEAALKDGVSEADAVRILMRAEADLLRIEYESDAMFRGLVKHCGTAAVAERRGITRGTVRRQYVAALNKNVHKTAA